MQSLPGFIVGIVFVLLGIFAVIPSSGAFGIIWTLVAGLITVFNGINVFRRTVFLWVPLSPRKLSRSLRIIPVNVWKSLKLFTVTDLLQR